MHTLTGNDAATLILSARQHHPAPGRGARMSPVTAWRTDEPCPVCGTGLTVLDDGQAMTAECRLCGYGDTWPGFDTDGGDR
jgi:hypothetical protein